MLDEEILKAEDYALRIYDLEGIIFNLEYSHNKGEKNNLENIRKFITQKEEYINLLENELKTKDFFKIREYIENIVDNKKREFEIYSKEIGEIGSIFGFYNNDIYSHKKIIEVVSSYSPNYMHNSFYDFFYLVREHENRAFQIINSNHLISNFQFLKDISPIFSGDNAGIVRIKGLNSIEKVLRNLPKNLQNLWYDIRKEGSIFYHKGFEDYFEPIDLCTLWDNKRCLENSVLLAMPYDGDNLVEITLSDLRNVEIDYEKKPKLGKIDINGNYFSPTIEDWNKKKGFK